MSEYKPPFTITNEIQRVLPEKLSSTSAENEPHPNDHSRQAQQSKSKIHQNLAQ